MQAIEAEIRSHRLGIVAEDLVPKYRGTLLVTYVVKLLLDMELMIDCHKIGHSAHNVLGYMTYAWVITY